jgi:hypothetical protein
VSVYNLSDRVQQRLRATLRAGESVIWASQPNADDYLTSRFRYWPLCFPLAAYALYVTASGFDTLRPGDWTAALGLLFLLIGLGSLGFAAWLHHEAGSMIYAITNQRAIAIEGARSLVVKSYPVCELVDLERIERTGGAGDLILRTEHFVDSHGHRHARKHGFFAVDEVQCVERLVANLRETQAWPA